MRNPSKQKIEPRVLIAGKAPRRVRDVVKEIAREEDRPFSNMLAHLLAESPRVKERLDGHDLQTA